MLDQTNLIPIQEFWRRVFIFIFLVLYLCFSAFVCLGYGFSGGDAPARLGFFFGAFLFILGAFLGVAVFRGKSWGVYALLSASLLAIWFPTRLFPETSWLLAAHMILIFLGVSWFCLSKTTHRAAA